MNAKTIFAPLVALALFAGMTTADSATFTGVVAGYTQGTGYDPVTPGAIAEHTHAVAGGSATITFTYNAIGGDTWFNNTKDVTGIDSTDVVEAGDDYVVHLYLRVFDANGVEVASFIEDNDWEQSSVVFDQGALPTMSETRSVSGAAGVWTFQVDAHRGAAAYTIEVSH